MSFRSKVHVEWLLFSFISDNRKKYTNFQLGVNKIVTGHNADDIAETVIMNILR